MISIRNLSVTYGKQCVLNNITENFNPGVLYGIVGFNGAGKTTFFNALAGVVKPNSGVLLHSEEKLSRYEVAYLETTNYFYSSITGREYLQIFRQTNDRFNLDALQEFMKLPLDQLIETYSSGMKKKVALLAVLKQDKAVYLFDEPFNGLDIETNKVLESIVLALREKGKIILLSSHIIDPLYHICDEIKFLEQGTFTKSFNRDNFHSMEGELFGKLKEDAKKVIARSI